MPNLFEGMSTRFEAVVVEAVRSWDGEERDVRHRQVRNELIAMVAVCGELVLRAGSDGAGRPALTCALAMTPAAEVVDVLASAFVCSPVPDGGEARAARRWEVVGIRDGIGFASSVAGAAVQVLDTWPGHSSDAADRWFALAACHPGMQLEIAITPGSGDRLRARIAVLAADPPTRRVEAFVRDWLPGFALREAEEGTALDVDRSTAVDLLPIPRTGEAGFASAALPPIPVRGASPRPSGSSVRLGHAVLPAGRAVDVVLAERDLVRHLHVLGQTGTGKSTALAALVHGAASAGMGLTLLDPHGELVDRCIAELPSDAASRTWVIRAGDVADPVPINPLSVEDDARFETVLQDLVLVFYQLFDPGRTGIVGPRFETLLTQGVRGLRALHGQHVSLLDVPRVYQDRALEQAVARAVTEPRQVDFWRREMAAMTDFTRSEMTGWFTSKFDRFATTAVMRAVLGTGRDAFDPATAMDDGRIMLVDLSKGELGSVAADLLGFLHLSRLWTGFQQRHTSKPHLVIVDEAQSFNAGSLPAMLSEGRKRGAAVVLAHQFLGQLSGPLGEAVEGNVSTTVAFRSGADDVPLLRRRMGESLPVARFVAAADLTAILNRGASSGGPHTLHVDHNERVVPRSGDELHEFEQRLLAGTHRALVDPHRNAPASAVPDRASSAVLDEWRRARHRAGAGLENDAADVNDARSS